MGVAMDNNPFRRYIACFLIAVWGSNLPLGAEPETLGSAGLAPSAATNISFSFSAPLKRAAWQQHLTLGPGDVLNMSLLDMPETARAEMPVGPDGRISYLQAENVMEEVLPKPAHRHHAGGVPQQAIHHYGRGREQGRLHLRPAHDCD
jgi:hypothetical protein